MSPQNKTHETGVLLLTLGITLSLVGGVFWWLADKSGVINHLITNQSGQIAQSNSEGFTQVVNVPSGLFSYGGSTTWAPIRTTVDSEIKKLLPKFQLRYTDPTIGSPGSGTGIKMLLDNQLAFSQSSRSIKDEEYQKAQQRGFTLKEVPVAIDGIAIAVNPRLKIPGLTITQIKDIYTGKLTNWEQVGGPNLPITAYSRHPEDGGTVEFFHDNVLEKDKFADQVKFISTTTLALREVANNPGGIYYASSPEVINQCSVKALAVGRTPDKLVSPYQKPFVDNQSCLQQPHQINTAAFQTGDYPITRRLFVIVKQNGQIDQQAGESYANLLLTEQGQKLITQAGFIRIR